jgi:hypothetical protein
MKKIVSFVLFTFLCFYANAQKRTSLPECKFVVVVEKANFYNSSDKTSNGVMTKRKAYLASGDIIWTVCKYSEEKFVYIEFTNKKGQKSVGFVKSEDLKYIERQEN